MTPTGNARLAGVIGWPIAHSLSPRLHGLWLAEHHIDGAYVPLAVRREDFSPVIRSLQLAGFAGVNVTVLHKEAAFALAHSRDQAADAAGAANLLTFGPDGRIAAANTDSDGLAAHLSETIGPDGIRGKFAVLLGAGGAARTAVLSLDRLGAAEICVLGRNGARADALANALKPYVKARLAGSGFADWPKTAPRAAIVLNATSAGMKGNPPLNLPLDVLSPSAVVCDLVYNPLETALLKDARLRGHVTIDGLGMLLHQAVPAFEAFFGVRPKVTAALRQKLVEALQHGR